jgi:hypothetical protein
MSSIAPGSFWKNWGLSEYLEASQAYFQEEDVRPEYHWNRSRLCLERSKPFQNGFWEAPSKQCEILFHLIFSYFDWVPPKSLSGTFQPRSGTLLDFKFWKFERFWKGGHDRFFKTYLEFQILKTLISPQ